MQIPPTSTEQSSIPLGIRPATLPLMNTPDSPDYQNALACIRCGLCLSVCPTYATDRLEVQSPRGRVALIRAVDEGRLPLESPGFRDHMYHCLDCRACETICPSGVKVGELVLGARAEIEKQRRPGFIEWAIKKVALEWVLMSPERVEMVTIPLRLYQQLGLQWLVRKTRLLHRLPGPFKRLAVMEELLPKLPGRPLRSIIDEVTPAKGERTYQIGFFLGCVMNVVFAESSQSTLNVLVENGCEVVTPKAQKCCGAPHAGEGDFKGLRELARQNVDLFSKWDLDYIVADCAACSAETKKYGELLHDEPEYAERAKAFSSKVRDISEFLTMIPLRQPKGEINKRVTYHEACHLCHAQGVTKEPRKMIESVPGVELVEMNEADWCCGSAGVYNLTHPERAEKILERKMGNATATGAEIVVTGNPGCLMQLEAGARRYNKNTKVLHPVQLLDAAYQGVEEPAGATRRT